MHIPTEREALLQQEQDLLKALASVRYQLNGTTPIGKLPTEIISEIFRWTAVKRASSPPYTGKVLHVCRRWYEVAMATPDLWSVVQVIEERKQIDAYLMRSKDAPLDVVISPSIASNPPLLRPSALPVLRNIFHHAHRIRTIDFFLHHSHFLEFMEGLPKVHLPRLRYLSVTAWKVYSEFSYLTPSNFTFGSLNCPDMRELSITRCDFPFEKIIDYTKLTSLTINLSIYTAIKAPSEMLMLDILRATPDLVSLCLLNAFLLGGLATGGERPEDSANTKGHTILLPRLSSAELSGDAAAIAIILRHVHFPGTARLLLPSVDSRSPAGIEALVGPLQARLDGSAMLGPPLLLQSMHVHTSNDIRVVVQGWVKTFHDVGLGSEGPVLHETHLYFQSRYPRYPTEPDFEVRYSTHALDFDALCMVPLQNIQSLWLTSWQDSSPHPTLDSVYKNSQRVLELRLRHFSADDIVMILDSSESLEGSESQDGDVGQTLVQTAGTNSGTGVGFSESISSRSSHSRLLSSADFNFPNLQALHISNTRFRNYLHRPENGVADLTTPTKDLCEVLRKRKEAGLDFPRLVFTECRNLTKAAVQAAQLMGCEVEWDGLSTVESDGYESTDEENEENEDAETDSDY